MNPDNKWYLLKLHMDCDDNYIQGHAQVAGMLANGSITTYADYKQACKLRGINHYRESLFDNYNTIFGRKATPQIGEKWRLKYGPHTYEVIIDSYEDGSFSTIPYIGRNTHPESDFIEKIYNE